MQTPRNQGPDQESDTVFLLWGVTFNFHNTNYMLVLNLNGRTLTQVYFLSVTEANNSIDISILALKLTPFYNIQIIGLSPSWIAFLETISYICNCFYSMKYDRLGHGTQ